VRHGLADNRTSCQDEAAIQERGCRLRKALQGWQTAHQVKPGQWSGRGPGSGPASGPVSRPASRPGIRPGSRTASRPDVVLEVVLDREVRITHALVEALESQAMYLHRSFGLCFCLSRRFHSPAIDSLIRLSGLPAWNLPPSNYRRLQHRFHLAVFTCSNMKRTSKSIK
jgi:hypothetical protein